MAPKPKTSSINVRLSAEEMTYLAGLADDLEITLSDAVRAAIARSILRDITTGERDSDSDDLAWLARSARSVQASPLTDTDASHAPGVARKREKRPGRLSPAATPRR